MGPPGPQQIPPVWGFAAGVRVVSGLWRAAVYRTTRSKIQGFLPPSPPGVVVIAVAFVVVVVVVAAFCLLFLYANRWWSLFVAVVVLAVGLLRLRLLRGRVGAGAGQGRGWTGAAAVVVVAVVAALLVVAAAVGGGGIGGGGGWPSGRSAGLVCLLVCGLLTRSKLEEGHHQIKETYNGKCTNLPRHTTTPFVITIQGA